MIEKLQSMVEESQRIVFFGGAGTSTESNIPDFRSAGGLYNQGTTYPVEQLLSHSFFVAHPDLFYDFYKTNMMYLDAEPNAAHLKLAEMEAVGKLSGVVTQNIDGLHQKGGSKTVNELHGSVLRNYCMRCNAFYDATYVKEAEGVPLCSCGGVIKPDVVLYEEPLNQRVIQEAVEAISKADLLMIGGTSLVVYPAAGFIDYFRGKYLVIINKGETARNPSADLVIREPIGEVLKQIYVTS